MSNQPLLCGHDIQPGIEQSGKVARCSVCGSFWDLISLNAGFTYDASYPESRGHTTETIGQLKVRTLQRWLKSAGLDISTLQVCEVGFGGGWPLAYLNRHAQGAFGLEAISENLKNAAALGVEESGLFKVDNLPEKLPKLVDLWIYQDSFEHIPDPRSHLAWVVENSTPDAAALLVLPEAGSVSEKLLGRWWPHRIADHTFHWSQKGLEEVWQHFGFEPAVRFAPSKCITLGMLGVHLAFALKINIPQSLATRGPAVWFNIGEQGILFRRKGRI
jgi:hypothetical protein